MFAHSLIFASFFFFYNCRPINVLWLYTFYHNIDQTITLSTTRKPTRADVSPHLTRATTSDRHVVIGHPTNSINGNLKRTQLNRKLTYVQRCIPHRVNGIDIGSLIKEVLYHSSAPNSGRYMHGCATLRIWGVYINAQGNQPLKFLAIIFHFKECTDDNRQLTVLVVSSEV